MTIEQKMNYLNHQINNFGFGAVYDEGQFFTNKNKVILNGPNELSLFFHDSDRITKDVLTLVINYIKNGNIEKLIELLNYTNIVCNSGIFISYNKEGKHIPLYEVSKHIKNIFRMLEFKNIEKFISKVNFKFKEKDIPFKAAITTFEDGNVVWEVMPNGSSPYDISPSFVFIIKNGQLEERIYVNWNDKELNNIKEKDVDVLIKPKKTKLNNSSNKTNYKNLLNLSKGLLLFYYKIGAA